MGELDHVNYLDGLELLAGGFRLHDVETLGAAGSIHHDGNRAAGETLLGPFELGLVSLQEALRLPRGAAAQASGVQRGHRHSGAFTQGGEGLGNTAGEHGLDAGRKVESHRVLRFPGLGTPAALGEVLRVLGHDVRADDLARHLGDARGGRCDGVRRGHRDAGALREWPPRLGGGPPHPAEHAIGLLGAQPAHQVAGVDVEGADLPAHAVDGAGLDGVVVVVLVEVLQELLVKLVGGQFPAQRYPLPRREGEFAGGADRFAETALHAAVHLVLDAGHQLEVLQVALRVVGQHHTRVQDSRRIEQALDLAHHLVEFIPVLAGHERGHDASGAVLGLEVPAVPDHQVDHVLGEVDVALHARWIREVLVEHEVDVAVLGVTEDDGVFVLVLPEQLDELGAGVQQRRHGHHDVLEQGGRAGIAVSGDRGVQTLADVPQPGTRGPVAGGLGGARQRQRGQQRRHGLDLAPYPLGGGVLKFQEQRGLAGHVQFQDLGGGLGKRLRHPERLRIHQLDGRETGCHQIGERGRGLPEGREDGQGRGRVGRHRNGPEGG